MTKAEVWGNFCWIAMKTRVSSLMAHGAALAAGGQLNQGSHLMGKKALWGMGTGLAQVMSEQSSFLR